MSLDGREREFIYFLGYLYLQYGKFQKALILFDALAASGEESWRLHMARGEALLNLDRADRAAEAGRAAHRLCGSREQERLTLLLMARAMWKAGDREEGRKYFSKFVKMAVK